jgi:hypothetical protein
LILLICMAFQAGAQRANNRSRSEFGFLVGGSYYIGDLNQYSHFKNTNFAAGVLYRFNVHSRLAIRANLTYGSIEASDAESKFALLRNRNLSFQSKIYELAGGVEFNYFPFQIGHSKYRGTAYLLAEMGLFHMNPTTEYNGEEIELQSVGTEGQGTELSSKKGYGKTQLTIPLGLGCRFSLGKSVSLSFEYGIRKTFTDYIDDVGSNRYVDATALAAINGPIAGALSNRSLDGSRYGKRGNTSTGDWYSFFGMMLTFRLGSPDKCFHFTN